MDHYWEKISTFFNKFAHGFVAKQRPTIAPPSETLRSPAPQTSLILGLPDELILSILSHISPEPQLTSHYARFRVQYNMDINDCHQRRVEFLRALSMTCKAMRLRLLPWIWERIGLFIPVVFGSGEKKLTAIVNVLHADACLATSVKFMTVEISWKGSAIPLFVRCLQSLPNLHTLEIVRADDHSTSPLKGALKRVKLPQIKALILPPVAHPLLRPCCDVEDVVCVVGRGGISSGEFLGSLEFNRDSKIKRLAIPLVMWANPSRFVAACPRLTELTIIYPHDSQWSDMGILLDPVGSARSAASELVNACKALPDFDTLQIVYFFFVRPLVRCACGLSGHGRPSNKTREPWAEQRKQISGTKGVKDLVIDCLKPKAGCHEGEGRKKTTLRIIELGSDSHYGPHYLDSVKVEEYEV